MSKRKAETQQDQQIVCKDCSGGFTFTVREQTAFAAKGFQAKVRCADCTKAKKVRRAHTACARAAHAHCRRTRAAHAHGTHAADAHATCAAHACRVHDHRSAAQRSAAQRSAAALPPRAC